MNCTVCGMSLTSIGCPDGIPGCLVAHFRSFNHFCPARIKPEVRAFLDDLAAVCRKHGLSISHEDGHGAFLVEEWREDTEEWLLQARDDR